jgi:DNA ligase-1
MDPKGWYMSEKLDGVRCYWNGRTLYSRNKNIYSAPKFFTEGWPNSPLDGELFLGRD